MANEETKNAWKRRTPEQIESALRDVHRLVARGVPVEEATRRCRVARPTYYRWKRAFGGLDAERIRQIKDMEAQNQRLRRYLTELEIENVA